METVGPLPDPSSPTLRLPDLSPGSVAAMLGPALGITVVAYSDNVLTARAFAERKGQRIDANQEFLALGVSNVAGGLLSGFPVSSSGSRTAIGASLGSRTQLYSLVTLASVVVARRSPSRPVIAAFPQAALGALVVYAAIRLVDVAEIRRVARFRRSELVLLVATTLGVFAFGALNGILLAVALSLGDLLRRVARPHDGILGYVRGIAGMHDVDDFPDGASRSPGSSSTATTPRCSSPTPTTSTTAPSPPSTRPTHPVEWLLINAEANVEVDLTSLDALDRLRRDLDARGRRAGPGAGEAGPPRRSQGRRARRCDRHRPHVPDAADRRHGLPRLVRGAARAAAPFGPVPPARRGPRRHPRHRPNRPPRHPLRAHRAAMGADPGSAGPEGLRHPVRRPTQHEPAGEGDGHVTRRGYDREGGHDAPLVVDGAVSPRSTVTRTSLVGRPAAVLPRKGADDGEHHETLVAGSRPRRVELDRHGEDPAASGHRRRAGAAPEVARPGTTPAPAQVRSSRSIRREAPRMPTAPQHGEVCRVAEQAPAHLSEHQPALERDPLVERRRPTSHCSDAG